MKAIILALLCMVEMSGCYAGSLRTESTGVMLPLCYYPCDAKLMGTLITEDRWGPPNFGETPDIDAKIKIYVLKLDDPVSVEIENDPKNVFHDVREVQLDFPINPAYTKFVGQRVIVVGTLTEGVAPAQYTKIVVDTQSLMTR